MSTGQLPSRCNIGWNHIEFCVQDATYGLLWAIPRIAWLGFFALMLAWIVYSQNGFAYNNTKLGSQGYLNHHYIFMTVAWPICMFEAIFSYRAPIYVLPHSK